MEVDAEGVLHFVNHDTGRWHRLVMTVKKAGKRRMQLRVLRPSLPYPAVWDMTKLIGSQEVWFDVNGVIVRGRPSGGGGRNLTVSDLSPSALPLLRGEEAEADS